MAQPTSQSRPVGFVPLGAFFFFGSVMASYASFTLLVPGTVLDRGWAVNPEAYSQLRSLGSMMSVPFAFLAIALLVAAIGWFRRRRWGWTLGVTIIAINLTGDLINSLRGEWLKGGVGVLVAGLLLSYMTRPGVKDYFLA